MTRRRLVPLSLLVVAGLVLAPAAAAQLARSFKPMTAAEARAELYGINMAGYSVTFAMNWTECIQPNGETLYHTPSGVQHGRLRISEAGEACFSYEDSNYQDEGCFRVTRRGKGYQFEEAVSGSLFTTTAVVRGVKSCKPEDELVS